ncbi:hypothetical protein [Eubacterium aggregans]|uniref:hypothetical protein n=1 Tax=Eubacterium aggregans TaxID=81409 RepID=UPI003F2A1FD8
MLHPENTYFHIQGTSMGSTRTEDMDIFVVVDPKAYYDYEYAKKAKVAHLIGEINTYYKNQGLQMMLIVPDRIGTSSPELGVPVVFADISEFSVVCKVLIPPRAINRSCPTAAICSKIWWKAICCTAPFLKMTTQKSLSLAFYPTNPTACPRYFQSLLRLQASYPFTPSPVKAFAYTIYGKGRNALWL